MKHTVRDGECIESIADMYGFLPETIWEYPDNAPLHEKGNRCVLQPGDTVVIPDRSTKTVNVATDAEWKFRRKGVPTRFRLELVIDDKVISKAKYSLEIDNSPLPPVTYEDVTGENGEIDHWISPDAKQAVLRVEDHEFTFMLGNLDPVGTEHGLVQRLYNLGYINEDALAGSDIQEELAEAIYAFQESQASQGLVATGEPDDATRRALVQAHGS